MSTTVIPPARPTTPQLGQLRRIDLLARALRRAPRGNYERHYRSMSNDALIDLLTRGEQ